MPRLHKLRRRQKFQYNLNRKQLNKKKEKLPTIKCNLIRKAWNERKSLNDNLTSMGLIADTNAHPSFRISSGKQQMMPARESVDVADQAPSSAPPQRNVVDLLQEEAKSSFQSKKAVAHPIPKPMLKKLTGWIDKYGEDYDAMSRDFSNYNQETPAQIRSQINRLKKIPQQWIPYLKRRGLLQESTEPASPDTSMEGK